MNIYGGFCELEEEFYQMFNESFPPIYLNIEEAKFEILLKQNYGEYQLKLINKLI